MSEGKRFSRESLIYLIGETLSKLPGFLLLPAYTSYLSVDDFAIVSLVTALWPLIVVFLGVGFSTYILRGYYEHTDDRRSFVGTVLIFTMTFGLCIALSIHFFGPWLFANLLKKVAYQPYLRYAVFFAFFRLYFGLIISYFRAKRVASTTVFLSTILFTLNAGSVLFAIYVVKADLVGIFNLQLAAFLVIAAIFTVKILPEISFKLQTQVIIPGIKFVIPLVPHALSTWLIGYVSTIIIERSMTLADLSVYAVALKLASVLLVVNYGLNQAWSPMVFANFERADAKTLLSQNAQRMFLLVVLVAAVLAMFSRELLMLMRKPEYLQALEVMTILILGYVFQIVFFVFVPIIIYNKNIKLLPVISLISGAVAVAANMILVPVLGIHGAALSTVCSYASLALLASLFAERYMKLRFLSKRAMVFLLCVVVVVTATYMLSQQLSFLLQLGLKALSVLILVLSLIKLKLLNVRNIAALLQN